LTSARRNQYARSSPPDADELEVSIFGPGKGEAIAVHLGGGDWITVDSCVNQRTRRNALLDYFDELQVDVESRVRLIVGTHAHDDHIAGIADLFEAARSATFVCSSALASEEFLYAVKIDKAVANGIRPSIREQYERVFAEARRRKGTGGVSLRRAVEGRVIWSSPGTGGLPAAEVLCLSPSDEAVTRSHSDFAKGAVAPAGDRKRFTNRDPNEFAVALWLRVGEVRVLLGADLLVGPEGCGWAAVMQNISLDGQAGVFKVPHHGSITGHHEPVWTDLLEPDPIALLAPYRGGSKSLPASEDVERIRARSSRAYITASPASVAKRRAIRNVSMALGGLASDVRDPWGTVGQVRARRYVSDQHWELELFDPARELSQIS
jgi:beta-lactamase superfamily II metal-dependent hydrolase